MRPQCLGYATMTFLLAVSNPILRMITQARLPNRTGEVRTFRYPRELNNIYIGPCVYSLPMLIYLVSISIFHLRRQLMELWSS